MGKGKKRDIQEGENSKKLLAKKYNAKVEAVGRTGKAAANVATGKELKLSSQIKGQGDRILNGEEKQVVNRVEDWSRFGP